MTNFLAYLFTALGFVFAIFFVVYGIKAGIINKRILVGHPSNYVEGKSARIRGIFYIFIGLFFLLGSAISLFPIISKINN